MTTFLRFRLCGCIMTLVSCGHGTAERTTAPVIVKPPQVISIAIVPAIAAVPVGGTLHLSANVAVVAGASAAISWSSSDTLAAVVAADGTVSARRVSPSVRICATSRADQTMFACADVRVNEPVVWERVTVVPSETTLRVGESVTLYAAVAQQPAGSTTFTWTSADTLRVIVNGEGRVTARASTVSTAVCARPASHPDWVACANVIVR